MILTNKLLPVALIAALVGGSVGALVMHKSQPATAETTTTAAPATQTQAANTEETVPAEFNTAGEQTAYKTGFADGFSAATDTSKTSTSRTPSRVVYRNSNGRVSSNRVYYNYEPRKRSFWDKHRDKLTVAMGTGGGALIGGLIGGKKGAAIGALSGGGGSALYTYKLRNRHRNY